jgi:hypothetical protein
MTFRSIHELAGSVLQRIGAPDHAPLEEQTDRALARGPGEYRVPRMLNSAEGTLRAMGIEVAGRLESADDVQPCCVKTVKEPSAVRSRPVLRALIGGKGLDSARRRARGCPAPALSKPLLRMIEGGHS